MARSLKSRHIQLIAIGGTIGTGLFLGAGQSIHLAGPSILLAYLLAGIMCFALMRALGELMLSDVDQHSFVDFINRYLGPRWAFITGWTYWVCWIAIAMAEVTAIGLYIRFWLPGLPQWVPGLIALALLALLNLISVGAFGETEFWFALIKVAAIIALIAIGAVMIGFHYRTAVGHASLHNLTAFGGFFPTGVRGFFLSFQMVTFSFVGIEMVGMTAGEAQDPEKVIPEAINKLPVRIILFYIGALFVLMCIYPWNTFSANASPFVQVFNNVGIKIAADVINFVVLTAAASACNSSLFSTGRMLFSLTLPTKGKLHWFSHLSRRQVPARAIVGSALVIAVAVLLNMVLPDHVFSVISSVATTSFLFVWSMIILAHLRFKKAHPGKTAFPAPLFPVADWFVLAFLLMIAVVMMLRQETAIAELLAIAWLIFLAFAYRLRERRA
ncbi:amino acid permease [Lacticaseibacillus yichunensis]|uniref:Amino acid permease n=1 Tax=Lacticaseibacillus yichunensis TaxID=2486015 RepID=A0ABW4CP37_9LACO|nr:amino acid permease [Lacticaseibacillus yichunensis]